MDQHATIEVISRNVCSVDRVVWFQGRTSPVRILEVLIWTQIEPNGYYRTG